MKYFTFKNIAKPLDNKDTRIFILEMLTYISVFMSGVIVGVVI